MSYTILPYALTRVANIKTYIGETSSTYDDLLGLLTDSATDFIEEYCGGRRFVCDTSGDGTAAETTEYHNGFEKRTLQLRRWPIISITSVSYASGDLDSPTWNALDPASDYSFNDLTGELRIGDLIASDARMKNIKVVYKGGYVAAWTTGTRTLPKNLELACIMLVAEAFNKRKSSGITNESVGGASIAWRQTELDPMVKKILDSYKRRSF